METNDIRICTMTPMEIIMLIEVNCFAFQDQITSMNGSPAAKKFTQRLLSDELIKFDPKAQPDDDERDFCPYKTTPRGRALIDKLCCVALPYKEERWV